MAKRSETLQLIIETATKGGKNVKTLTRNIQGGFDRGRKAVQQFNATSARSGRVMSGLSGKIKGLIAAYAGWQTVMASVRVVQAADQAVFNLKTSVEAANREFGESVGTATEWESAIKRLSGELKVYSETSLRNAVSRTVDMTKRLGLSAEQMQEVIKRSADLGAGKVELEGAIERVTAALRGEAEASEYLGLTLNENFVRAWYEARGAMQGAWKDLNDLQKAQVRYALFLEQSEELQGRAAESAKTFAGSVALIKAAITDAIANNEDLVDAMNEAAKTLRENADEIGAFVGQLVSLGARLATVVVEWKEWIAAIAGSYVAVNFMYRLVVVTKALRVAVLAVTGTNFVAWIGSLRAALATATMQATALSAALRANAVIMAALAIPNIMRLGAEVEKSIRVLMQAQRLASREWEAAQKYAAAKDVQIRSASELADMTEQERRNYAQTLVDGLRYWSGMEAAARRTGQEYGEYEKHTLEIGQALKALQQSGEQSFDAVIEAVEAGDDALDKFADTAKKAYEKATEEAEKHADRIKELEEEIQFIRMDTEDQIRALRRKAMSDEQAWHDQKVQVEEKIAAARKAMAEGDSELSRSLLEDAKSLAAGLATEVTRKVKDSAGKTKEVIAISMKEAVTVATTYIQEIGRLRVQVNKNEIAAEEKARAALKKTAQNLESMLNRLAVERESTIKVTVPELEMYERRLAELTKDATKTITIKTVEKRSAGGRAGIGMAAGGRFPGNSKVDSIHVLARPGEGFVRNEALSVWDRLFGPGFFEGVNNPWSKAGQEIKNALLGAIPRISVSTPHIPRAAFATGGRTSGVDGLRNLGRVEIVAGGKSFPVIADEEVAESLKRTLKRESLMKAQ